MILVGLLAALAQQMVEPIRPWTMCPDEYALRTAGAAFHDGRVELTFAAAASQCLQSVAIEQLEVVVLHMCAMGALHTQWR